MEGYCSTDQNPQRAVVPMEEEEDIYIYICVCACVCVCVCVRASLMLCQV